MIPTHQAAAAVLILNEFGQVLMVANPYRDRLVLPGGIVESDESPAKAAAREVQEETSLVVTPTRLLALEHLPAGDQGPSGLRFIFDTHSVSNDVPLVPQPDEVSELLWLHPAEAVARHTARGQHRLELALRAKDSSSTYYLDGSRTLGDPGR